MSLLILLAALLHHKVTQVKVGDFTYKIVWSKDSMGETLFPSDDTRWRRSIVLPLGVGDEQVEQVYVHEVMHACFHNHLHKFNNLKELEDHLDKDKYEEEQAVETLAPCVIEALDGTK